MTALADLHDPQDTALIRTLGHAGLIPFVGLALLLWLVTGELQTFVSIALAGYAALIVSFLGGIHWGIAWMLVRTNSPRRDAFLEEVNGVWLPNVTSPKNHLLWGITASLLAWPGLLMPPFAGLAWLGFMLILCYLADRTLYAHAGLQTWLTLRFRLSAVAAVSCFVGAGAL